MYSIGEPPEETIGHTPHERNTSDAAQSQVDPRDEPRPIEPEVKRDFLAATLRAPTAGNLMLYSIIDITDQATKDALAESCDNQPFIATAPMLWLFVADYQRWWASLPRFGRGQGLPAARRRAASTGSRRHVAGLLRRTDRGADRRHRG